RGGRRPQRQPAARVPGRSVGGGPGGAPVSGGPGVLDLSLWQVGLAVLLVGLVILVSVRERLGLERDLVLATARAVGQLYLVGLVQLPGMMTGQILAGSAPLVAIEYQLVVICLLAGATALASVAFVRLAAARYLTRAHQFRRYLLLD